MEFHRSPLQKKLLIVRVVLMLSTLLAFTKSLTRKVIVRGAPAIRKYNTATMSTTERLYAPFRKHAELFDGEDESSFPLEYLHEDYVQILDAMQKLPVDDDVDPDTVAPNLLKKEMEGVYSFNVFDKSFIQLFNEEIENFYYISEREHIPVRRPNSMNNYGVVVNEIGLRPLITSFQQEYLWPLARRLFPIQASQFDDHHSFIVRYRANEDLGLDMHTDSSDVTFNVCLGEPGFTGATLTFCGMFGAANHRQHTHTYQHQIGRAVLHLGSRRHGADDIATGRRSNLIVWNQNWKYQQSGGYRNVEYEQEQGPPSAVCLSYTHDRDFQSFRPLPAAAQKQTLRPWCPPPGTEYDGFRESKKKSAKDSTGIQSQDEL